ncbi:hypothetical protein MVEN_01500900 [Mycena venus]|uniref:Uncharacterized protein n=1 Tax=Mycena venus TaxID=2733690 RepID=A0A8H6XW07_9AGAR|nr:hypothetical protein MVEN_01500900 [Mycena venus]
MSVAAPEMRSISAGRVTAPGKKGPMQSLVISPNLDALLEHDERVRRAQQGGTWSSMDSPGYPSPTTQGLPPPPRRTREDLRSDTPQSADSNPYINPAPQWVEEPVPYSPPPRTSSMGVDVDSGRRPRTADSSLKGGPLGNGNRPRQSDDRSQSSSGTSSPGDSRFPPHLTKSPSLPRVGGLLKRSPRDKEKDENKDIHPVGHKRSRSKGKLVKPRDSGGSQTTPSSPQMSEITATPRIVRRQRSSRSISVSSAISTDRESFIDLFSPSNQDFPTDLTDAPFAAASPTPSSLPRPPKPPVPTTPKPDFSRRSVIAAAPRRPSPVGPPTLPVRAVPPDSMPPTTNFLNPTERAQLIKKSRKLAQVFGQTPGAAEFVPDARSSFLDVSPPGTTKSRQGHRPAASMNMIGQMPPTQRPIPPWPAPDKTIYMNAQGRRHSTPSTPISDEGQTVSIVSGELTDPDEGPHGLAALVHGLRRLERGRPRRRRARGSRPRIPASPSSPSLLSFETMTPEEQAEEERRKKRDKLAKLHRFLGSRVPTSLVLGSDYMEGAAPLPPPDVALDGTLLPDSDSRPKAWRRRSSSAAVMSSWSDDLDRLKEDLNDKEKASLVRRAQKMEKVFGVAPPQKLYSAQRGSSGSSSLSGTVNSNPYSSPRTEPASPATTPPATFGRNPNQAPYKRKQGSSGKEGRSRSGRPGTADSDQFLLPNAEPSAGSFVYTHYQHSLNSLHDILDRNDKESLAELHQYLNDTSADEPLVSPLEFGARPPLTKVERRRSLPARTSLASLASIASASSSLASLASIGSTTTGTIKSSSPASTPDGTTTEFQQRRRRAAKLTQFFGVDYRDLIEDVLESIEHGLDAERSRGDIESRGGGGPFAEAADAENAAVDRRARARTCTYTPTPYSHSTHPVARSIVCRSLCPAPSAYISFSSFYMHMSIPHDHLSSHLISSHLASYKRTTRPVSSHYLWTDSVGGGRTNERTGEGRGRRVQCIVQNSKVNMAHGGRVRN